MTILETQHDRLHSRYGGPAEPLLPPLTEAELNEVLRTQLNHASVRAFTAAPVPDAMVGSLVAAAQSASTSSNLQAWSVVVVRDPERKDRLATLAGDQDFIRQAPLFLVWLVDLARIDQIAAARGRRIDGADYLESALLGFIDVALAAQNAMLAAESLGLGGVFVGAVRNHPEDFAAELNLPPRTFAAFGHAIGWPDPDQPSTVKPRLPQAAVVHLEQYAPDAQTAAVTDYEERMASF
ncbi:MAG: NADPH-dependent oxidoreductase, partial [Propionibacteriaceae bacterium]